MITLADPAALRAHVGRELAVSDWIAVTQERIAQFADATGDHQWIHLDGERAARESPYGTTIAHGFLTLSLVSALLRTAVSVGGVRLTINYGLNRVRFVSAVPAGARIRARVSVAAVDDTTDGALAVEWHIVVEREGAEKPCVVADWLVRYYAASADGAETATGETPRSRDQHLNVLHDKL